MASPSSRASTATSTDVKATAPTSSAIPQSTTLSTSTPQSTTFSTSASRTSPADALTTPFEPPAKCSQDVSRFANTACMPPNWQAYWYGNTGYYSPAVCPQSYGIVAPRPSNVAATAGFGPSTLEGEVAVICCPSGYITVSGAASFCSSASSSAYAVQVRWQYSDIPRLQGITDMIKELSAMPTGGYSTITAASTPTVVAVAAPSSKSGGLSTGAKAAIGIIIPLLVISAFVGALMFFMKRRRRRLQADSASPNLDKATFHSHASSDTSVTLRHPSSVPAASSSSGLAGKGGFHAPQVSEDHSLAPPSVHQSHISLSSNVEPSEKSPRLDVSQSSSHRPQVSLTIPAEAHLPGHGVGVPEGQHGDTPLLPRAPSPTQFHTQQEMSQAMSSPLQDYGYSRIQRLSREDEVFPGPAFVAPLPPPTADRPEPLRIRQSAAIIQPAVRTLRRASSTPSLAPVTEVVTEDRYMVPPGTAEGEPTDWPVTRYEPESHEMSTLTTASFALSPGSMETPQSEYSPLQVPLGIAELEAEVVVPKPLSIKTTPSVYSPLQSPGFPPNSPPRSKAKLDSPGLAPQSPPRSKSSLGSSSTAARSPPRSKSAMDRPHRPQRLDIAALEPPPQRCRSALDQSPIDRTSSSSDEIPFRPTTPQALPRVFSQKRTGNPLTPRMNHEALPKLEPVPDYAGADYGDTSGSAVDVQDEEMVRRVRERKMLEERERRLEQAVDARYSWRGAPGGHKRFSQSFG